MANHLVSGHAVPDAVSGHVGLELANTRTGWRDGAGREYLVSYDALAVWAGDVGLLSSWETRQVRTLARTSPREAEEVLDETLALRDGWYALATAACTGQRMNRDDLGVVGAAVAAATAVSELVEHDDGRVLPDGGRLATAGLRLPLHRAALAAGELLASGDVAHVGQCGGRGCGWLFLDPGHRRHWCIMAVCGNRAKARAFAERRRRSLHDAAGAPTG